MLNFVLPTERDRQEVLAFYRDIAAIGGESIGMGNGGDFDRWLSEMQDRHRGENLPEGYVRENFYLCYEGDRLVGVFSLKFALTDYLLQYGGHIGYATRPADRNRGLATQMLRRGLELAKGFGFDRVLCVCNEDNAASEKVILRNGGVLENTLFDPEEQVNVKRYWIDL